MARFFVKLFRQIILVCLFASLVHYLVQHKSFIFSPKQIRTIAEKYNGQHPSQAQYKISMDLRRQYGSHVIPDKELHWVTLSAGGHRGKLLFLHASVTEFIAILGSPSKSSGHMGFHWQNYTCSLLTGSIQRWKDGPLAIREEFGPGERFSQYMFEVAVTETSEDTWMMCYGRGFMPASGPYLLGDTLISSVDPLSAAKLIAVYSQAAGKEILVSLQETFDYYIGKLTGKK